MDGDGVKLATPDQAAPLGAAIDRYEALRSTPGPDRDAAHDAIRPLLEPFGVFNHRGIVYHWSHDDDSLVRSIRRRPAPKRSAFDLPPVDAVVVRRRYHKDGWEDAGGGWQRYYRGRAI